MILSENEFEALKNARCAAPHDLLGMHCATAGGRKGVVARALVRDAQDCALVDLEGGAVYPMPRLPNSDVFELFFPNKKAVFAYRLRVRGADGATREFADPYCFLPTLSADDLYRFNQGEEHRVYEKLGSHVRRLGEVEGVSFAVWAPSARRVSVVGDFNAWDGRYHPMRPLGASGIWEIFIPGLGVGEKYKYEILGADGGLRLKSDPYAMRYEQPPNNASIVWDISDYKWGDDVWMWDRVRTDWQKKPLSVLEVHLGSWRRVPEEGNRPLTYREAADALLDYLKGTKFTHVEFLPLAEYPFDGSWGYQVTGFYAPTRRYGTPQDFMYLVDTLHRAGYGVLLDWVPAHFPKDAFSLAQFDGSHLYEHADPRQGEHQDWGTLIFNYGRYEVRDFLTGSALAWLDRFHIDGLRVDAVASMLYLDYSRREGEWIPNRYGGRENIEAIEFLRHTNALVHLYHKGALTIAEESTAFGGVTRPPEHGGLGFDLKWNMGWMHDTLAYFQKDPIFRTYHHNQLTFPMIYQFSENFVSVLSHDEVVHGKGSLFQKMGAWNPTDKARNLRVLFALMWLWPGKKTLFMGSEWGQEREWNFNASLDWHLLKEPAHAGIQRLVCDLNALYRGGEAFAQLDESPEGFQWIACDDRENCVISFLRVAEGGRAYRAVVCNMTPIARARYRIGLPARGRWREILNTNAEVYGGAGEGNLGGVDTQDVSWNARPYSAEIYLPGLSVCAFEWGSAAPVPPTAQTAVVSAPEEPAGAPAPAKPARASSKKRAEASPARKARRKKRAD